MGPSWGHLKKPVQICPGGLTALLGNLGSFSGPRMGSVLGIFFGYFLDIFFDYFLATFGAIFRATFCYTVDPKLDLFSERLLKAVWSHLGRLLGCLGALL